jgi:YidC/Oxa1 family membrane protein insertase
MASIVAKPGSAGSYRTEAYIGPRDFFNLREAGFEQAFPLGILAKIGLMLMLLLKLLAHIFHNYGVAVILLAAGITSALSPFTMISYRSMKKMQELQPRMDAIKKKYGSDSAKANQEVFALFKEHKVSPVSGCLPMLLQMPIFFALWSAITHVIELRGEHFLWIRDLSLPDRLAKLPGGIDLNILPILMAGAMFMQTKITQPKTTSSQSPFSGPMMSVLFGVMFYSVPAGLVLYWITNTLTSISWYKFSKI